MINFHLAQCLSVSSLGWPDAQSSSLRWEAPNALIAVHPQLGDGEMPFTETSSTECMECMYIHTSVAVVPTTCILPPLTECHPPIDRRFGGQVRRIGESSSSASSHLHLALCADNSVHLGVYSGYSGCLESSNRLQLTPAHFSSFPPHFLSFESNQPDSCVANKQVVL